MNDNYMERYTRVFRPTEIKMMLASFSNMETIHIAAYALLLETIGMPDIGVLGVHPVQGDARQARLHAEVRRRDGCGHPAHGGDVRRVHRRACSCLPRSRC